MHLHLHPFIHSFSSISGVSCSIIWIYLVCLVRLCVCVYDSNRAQFAHTLVWLQALQINLKSQNKKNSRAFFLFMLLLQRSQRWKKRNIPTITTQRKCKLANHKISDFFRLRNDTHTHTLSLSQKHMEKCMALTESSRARKQKSIENCQEKEAKATDRFEFLNKVYFYE